MDLDPNHGPDKLTIGTKTKMNKVGLKRGEGSDSLN